MSQKEHRVISLDTRTCINILLIATGVFAIVYLTDIVLVLLTSIVIASFIESAVAKLKHFHIPRTISVLAVFFLFLAAIVGLLYIFVPLFITEATQLATVLKSFLPQDNILRLFRSSNIDNAKDLVNNITQNAPITEVLGNSRAFFGNLSSNLFSTASSVVMVIVDIVLVAVISFYLSIQEKGIENFLGIVVPHQYEDYAISLWRRSERKIGLWVQGQFLLGIIVGILIFTGLTILGIKYAFFIALIAAVAEIIPYGLILAAAAGIVFSYFDGGTTAALSTGILFIIVQQLENYFISPMIVRRVVGVSPLVVILALLIGAKLAGFWGLVLAVPVAVCLMEYLSDLEYKKIAVKE
jgi:predicted PurR-regulated permease PerM